MYSCGDRTALEPDGGIMNKRANALADRLERGVSALSTFAGQLTTAEWKTPVPKDGRSVGVVVHHVASVFPTEIHLAQILASGKPVTGVTTADINAMNAAHAKENADTTKDDALRLLEQNGAAAADAIRAMSDEQLDRAAPASLYEDAPITTQFMLEDHAVRHSYHHLLLLRRALGASDTLTNTVFHSTNKQVP
jgi:hypothetical protein